MCSTKLDTISTSSANMSFCNLCEVTLNEPYSVLSDRLKTTGPVPDADDYMIEAAWSSRVIVRIRS